MKQRQSSASLRYRVVRDDLVDLRLKCRQLPHRPAARLRPPGRRQWSRSWPKVVPVLPRLHQEKGLACLRTCEKIRKRRARARKAVWQGAREGASPQRAVTERATRPDGLSCSRPQGCVSFWLGLRCSGGTAERRETACRRQPAGRCKASATPLRVLPPPSRLGQAKNPAATRHFVIFSQVLKDSNHAPAHRPSPPRNEAGKYFAAMARMVSAILSRSASGSITSA